MTFTAVLLILISWGTPDAHALIPSSSVPEIDLRAINELLNKANAIQIDVELQKERSKKSVAALKRNPDDPALKGQAAYDAEILADWVRERDLLRNKAIHRTLTAYKIVPADKTSGKPKMPSGTAVVSDYKGQSAHWRVIAGDDIKRTNINAHGVRIHTGPIENPDARAYTDGWGITIMYEKSFSSPEYLAFVLSHEIGAFRAIHDVWARG